MWQLGANKGADAQAGTPVLQAELLSARNQTSMLKSSGNVHCFGVPCVQVCLPGAQGLVPTTIAVGAVGSLLQLDGCSAVISSCVVLLLQELWVPPRPAPLVKRMQLRTLRACNSTVRRLAWDHAQRVQEQGVLLQGQPRQALVHHPRPLYWG